MQHRLIRDVTRNTLTLLGLLTVISIGLAGCGDGKPSEATIKGFVKQRMSSECADSNVVRVDNFKKTNGQDLDANHYLANLEFDVVLTRDVNVVWSYIPKDMTGDPACAWQAFFGLYEGRRGIYKSGSTIHNSTNLIFVKTENGWLPQ